MQIIYKVKEDKIEEAERIALKNVERLLHDLSDRDISVRQIFPGLATGQRARLFSISLPDQLPDDRVDELIKSLRKEDGIEYAELPSPKQPMKSNASKQIE